jgi:hypothetical protein
LNNTGLQARGIQLRKRGKTVKLESAASYRGKRNACDASGQAKGNLPAWGSGLMPARVALPGLTQCSYIDFYKMISAKKKFRNPKKAKKFRSPAFAQDSA